MKSNRIQNLLAIQVAKRRWLNRLFGRFQPEMAVYDVPYVTGSSPRADRQESPVEIGLRIAIDPRDQRGPSFHLVRNRNAREGLASYEAPLRRELRAQIERILARKGRAGFLDGGANIGLISLPLARELSNLEVVAFEMHPLTARILRKSVELNGLKNYRIEAAGLGQESGEVELFLDETDSGGHSIFSANLWNNRGKASASSVRAPIVALDAYAFPKSFELDVVKLDIQGAEDDFLRGATRTLLRFRPVLVMEIQNELVVSKGDVVNALQTLEAEGVRYRVRPIDRPQDDFRPLAGLRDLARTRFERGELFNDYLFVAE